MGVEDREAVCLNGWFQQWRGLKTWHADLLLSRALAPVSNCIPPKHESSGQTSVLMEIQVGSCSLTLCGCQVARRSSPVDREEERNQLGSC